MDRQRFFDAVRSAPAGRLSASQVAGFEAVLNAAPADLPIDHLAYCLATAWHETARTMQPIEEYGRGRGKRYGQADAETGKAYFGRGFVQLTWRWNYAKAGRELTADLVNNPELALRPDLAARIMFRGMAEGWFTSRKLADYFGPGKDDPVGARRIINGTDRAELIAGHYLNFVTALRTAGYSPSSPVVAGKPIPVVAVADPKPAPKPAVLVNVPKLRWWERLLGMS